MTIGVALEGAKTGPKQETIGSAQDVTTKVYSSQYATLQSDGCSTESEQYMAPGAGNQSTRKNKFPDFVYNKVTTTLKHAHSSRIAKSSDSEQNSNKADCEQKATLGLVLRVHP